jgi:hypothetical protein
VFENLLFYNDKAHCILLGQEGNAKRLPVNENIVFWNIDLLNTTKQCLVLWSHFHHVQDSITYRNILFENIRVEDFTEGSLVDLRIGCFWKTR